MSIFVIVFSCLLIVILIFSAISKWFSRKQPKLEEIGSYKFGASRNSLQHKYADLHRKMVQTLSSNYAQISVFAEGGMGVIARAWDEERQQYVAIKTILPELCKDQEVVQLFVQECQVIQAMNHPNIVRLYEVGETENLYYYVMEYLEGELLEDEIEKNKFLEEAAVVEIGKQVARALQHIHSNGLIHRDIKPSNIFYTNKQMAKIMDFGIAKLLSKEGNYSYSSVGSPLYASPEQIRGEEVTGKSDIYSLGICFFYMLSGEHPFSSSDLLSKMFESPKKLKSLNPKLSDSIIRIVDLCIDPDPEVRFPAHELWARLRAIR